MLANGIKELHSDAKVETIVFDLGGVLFTEGKSVALEVLSRAYGYDPDIVLEVLTCPISRDMRKGLVSEDDFWSWVEGQVPCGYDARVIKEEWYEGYVLDRDVWELVKRLKDRYRLVVFSENTSDRVAYLNEKYRFRELFDVEVYSFDHRVGKRDPRFLDILLTTLSDRPEEILYIDNSAEVLEWGERRGVNTVLYTTGHIARIEAALQRLGILV
jgi:FMN phosphatase YigB (HAD superfamily)